MLSQPHAVLLSSLAYLCTIHQYSTQCWCKCIMLYATYTSGIAFVIAAHSAGTMLVRWNVCTVCMLHHEIVSPLHMMAFLSLFCQREVTIHCPSDTMAANPDKQTTVSVSFLLGRYVWLMYMYVYSANMHRIHSYIMYVHVCCILNPES